MSLDVTAEPGAAGVPFHTFEALFVHGLAADEELKAALRVVGLDLAAPRDAYPPAVWNAALRVAALELFPSASTAGALRRLGHAFVAGVRDTEVGRVMASEWDGTDDPARFLARLPWYISLMRRGLAIDGRPEGTRRWRLVAQDAWPNPGFTAGVAEAWLRPLLPGVKAEVKQESGSGYEIVIGW